MSQERDKQTEAETDRQTERQRETETERERMYDFLSAMVCNIILIHHG